MMVVVRNGHCRVRGSAVGARDHPYGRTRLTQVEPRFMRRFSAFDLPPAYNSGKSSHG
jgi:hypothetical protein